MSSICEPPLRGADRLRLLLVSGGGLGLSPVAPGTFGTLGGVALAVPLAYVPGLPLWAPLAIAAGILLAAGVPLGTWAERHLGGKDPGPVVIDEVAGYLVTVAVFAVCFDRPLAFGGHVAAFVLFRIVDVLKPPPGSWCEKLPGGLGIMLDDVVLGLYSGGALALLGWMRFPWL